MTIAIDTNVLVRLLVRDDEAQYAAAQRWVDQAAAAEEPMLMVLGALPETEWAFLGRQETETPVEPTIWGLCGTGWNVLGRPWQVSHVVDHHLPEART